MSLREKLTAFWHTSRSSEGKATRRPHHRGAPRLEGRAPGEGDWLAPRHLALHASSRGRACPRRDLARCAPPDVRLVERAAGAMRRAVLTSAEGRLRAMSMTRTVLLAFVLVLSVVGLGAGLLAPAALTPPGAEARTEPVRPVEEANPGKKSALRGEPQDRFPDVRVMRRELMRVCY